MSESKKTTTFDEKKMVKSGIGRLTVALAHTTQPTLCARFPCLDMTKKDLRTVNQFENITSPDIFKKIRHFDWLTPITWGQSSNLIDK